MIKIRPATDADHDAILKIFREIISAGDTYALDPRMSRDEALAYWFRADTQTYVAELHRQSVGEAVGFPGTATQTSPQATARQAPSPTGGMKDQVIVGTYILRPNQSGAGSHVSNAAFMVARGSEGFGVGRRMAEHCLSEARRMGFHAMQFDFVISTNTRAIRLWKKLGFEIVGTLPGAFQHPGKGYVDVYVMYRSLIDD